MSTDKHQGGRKQQEGSSFLSLQSGVAHPLYTPAEHVCFEELLRGQVLHQKAYPCDSLGMVLVSIEYGPRQGCRNDL